MTKVDTPLHIPIMLNEILSFAEPVLSGTGRYLDGTFGRGGHLKSILKKFPYVEAVGLDRDLEAVDFGNSHLREFTESNRLRLVHQNYANYDPNVFGKFEFMLIDLGVSSPQLDQPERGFSFYSEGPIDMRMDLTQSFTALDIIDSYSEEELIRVFKELGEVRSPYRVVRAILHDRVNRPYQTTKDLAGMIERVDGWRKKGTHPATQYFLGLRLEVNQELEATRVGLRAMVSGLTYGGRLAVLTFHSLEDRIVKWMFKEELKHLGRPLFKKVVEPTQNELRENPRARSAKLRVFERSLQDADHKNSDSSV